MDAKNYKGGKDTAYRNVSATRLLRVCISQHAFENGPDGRPDLELSANMKWQRGNWNSAFGRQAVFKGKPIVAEWLVCMVPTTNKGVPDVSGVFWPGDIPCVTPEDLVKRVNAVDLDSVQNIPLDMLNMLKQQLKDSRRHPAAKTSRESDGTHSVAETRENGQRAPEVIDKFATASQIDTDNGLRLSDFSIGDRVAHNMFGTGTEVA